MADMTIYRMLDDVNVPLMEQHASGAHAVAGYVDGFTTWPSLVSTFEKSGKFLLSITIHGSTAAQCADYESGAMSFSQAVAWHKAVAAAGKKANDYRYYPKHYTSLSNLQTLVDTLTAGGIKRESYMIWSAHYTGSAHICGPKSCGSAIQADATQWTDTYDGVSLDASECYGYFFSGPPAATTPAPVTSAPAPAPAPTPAPAAPVRRAVVKDNKKSWTEIASDNKTTVGSIISTTVANDSPAHTIAFINSFVKSGEASVPAEGVIFWTV